MSFEGRPVTDQTFETLVNQVRAETVEVGLACVGRYRNRLNALEAELAATNIKDGGNRRKLERTLNPTGKNTKRDTKRRASRTNAINDNPALGDDLANDRIGTEQVDAIAAASDRTGGAAAKDVALIDEVKNANPDDANKITRKYVDDHKTAGAHERRRSAQRKLRKVSRFITRRETSALLIEGDDETIDEMHKVMTTRSNDLYEKDGGRDVPYQDHPRTRDERNYDAIHQAITGNPTPDDKPEPVGTDADGACDEAPDTTDAAEPETSTGTVAKREPRAGNTVETKIFLTMTVEDFLAGSPEARIVDGGKLPASLLDRYMCNSSILGVVFGGEGDVLWHGRDYRFATPEQTSALVARDGGCVRCHAGPNGCEAHHLTPYNAPAKGETKIDELALVCRDCHPYIHDNNLTLYKDPETGNWKLRPATPEETPRKQHEHQRKPEAEQPPKTDSTDPPPDDRAPPRKPTFTFRCEL